MPARTGVQTLVPPKISSRPGSKRQPHCLGQPRSQGLAWPCLLGDRKSLLTDMLDMAGRAVQLREVRNMLRILSARPKVRGPSIP